jgi:tetratricopeptide (TPR) repeat protein
MSSDDPDLTEDELASLLGARPATHVDAHGLDDDATATKREGLEAERPRRAEAAREGRLARGTTVGRYVVIDVLGAGGMGVVYSAYDPELDRKLAIKLLQARPASGSSSQGDQAWLLREAQALARLSHPNVVAVHDVGTLPGDRVFVAIELVEGVTLRQWVKVRRTWREVRRVLLDAGRGLAAAHAAGLVHRDFKPENVLVGNDGRVRVMDFGLARLSSDEAVAPRISDLSIDTRSPLSESLTIAGTAVGTPAYMAPEIFEGLPASARSDQFSFGVTLYEALFRMRPYDKQALTLPRVAGLAPRQPPKSDVPPRLQRIAMRAVAIAPDERYGSMDALLAELSIDPTAARRRAAVAASVIATVGILLAAAVTVTSNATPSEALLCKDAERHLTGVWDSKAKQTIKAAFDKTTRPFKHRALTSVMETLDRYANDWTTAVTESCEATRIRGEQSEEVQSLRRDCFDQRLEELGALARLLGEANDALVDKASTAALNLEPLKRCADVAALKAPAQPTAEIRPRLEKPRVRLADAKAGLLAGNFGRAINASEESAAAAKAIPFDPLLAESKLVLGLALIQVGNGDDALAALSEAAWAALRGKRDDIAAAAALYAALATAENLNKTTEAQFWLELGTAVGKRLGGERDRALELTRLELEGVVAGNRGDLIAATAAHEQALALSIKIHGREGTIVARHEQLLGATFSRAGDYARARPHYEHGLELMLKLLGPDHPDVALLLSGLASAYHYTGAIEKSHDAFSRALAIRERVFGANSPVLIPTLNNLAELLLDESDHVRGIPVIERAKAITEKTVGRGHPYNIIVTATLGEMLLLANRIDEARAPLDESVKLAERTRSPYLAAALTARARLARIDKKWTESAAMDTRAIALLEKSAGKDAPEMWKPLTGLALAKIALKQPGAARPLLERALAIGEKVRLPANMLEPTRAALAGLRDGFH